VTAAGGSSSRTGTPLRRGVLRAFGADPPPSRSGTSPRTSGLRGCLESWAAVRDGGDAVRAVGYNGFQGSREPVLRATSGRGPAAGVFWNVNALTCLPFAERGRLESACECPPGPGR